MKTTFAYSLAAASAIVTTCTVAALAHDPIQQMQSTSMQSSESEAAYLAENDAAMERMMMAMAVTLSGDVDRDFVAMMTPHHQGAIDMAMAVLKYGKNEQLRRLAQEIIVEQQQEIAAMKLAIGDPLPPSAAAPTQPGPANTSDAPMHGMNPDMKM